MLIKGSFWLFFSNPNEPDPKQWQNMFIIIYKKQIKHQFLFEHRGN